MKKFVSRYKILPSDAGITFEGFEKISIPSRQIVKKKLEDFIVTASSSRKPTLRVLLGEWGEGKTDAYRRFLKPTLESQGNRPLFVSASTIANSFSSPALTRLFDSTSLSSIKFLVALFNAIKEESHIDEIPQVSNFSDARTFLESTFQSIVKNKQKIVVFIDEFEELLTTHESLNRIISGLKETINGGYEEIDENGKFEGSIHFVVAATPDAFYQLQVKKDTALIFGGLGRRGSQIEIPQISRREAIQFLFELLKYSYGSNMPEDLPVESLGIFDTLCRVTQGNPGSMVSLFSKLLASVTINEKQMAIIDSERLLRFLENEQGFIYGMGTNFVEKDLLARLCLVLEDRKDVKLGESCSKFLRILLGQLVPFSTGQIQEYLPKHDVHNIRNEINRILREREHFNSTIVKLSPVKSGTTFQDIIHLLREYVVVKGQRKYLEIDGYSEEIQEFQDKISFPEFIKGNISFQMFLPADRSSISSYFDGISTEKAVELDNIFRRLCNNDSYYMISEEITRQIFPTPIPRELEFIVEREIRTKLWRDVSKNLGEQFAKYASNAVFYLLNTSNIMKLQSLRKSTASEKYIECNYQQYQWNALIYSINGDVEKEDVDRIFAIVKGADPIVHCILLIYSGEKTPEAIDKLSIKSYLGSTLDNYLIEIPIHPTLAKRVLGIYRASTEYPSTIKQDTLEVIVKRIIREDFDLETKISEWMTRQSGLGRVVPDFSLQSTSNLRLFGQTLRFFINFRLDGTLQEIYERNRNELLPFIRYESRTGLIPDIEFPEFVGISSELTKYGFLKQENNIFRLQSHIVEKEIARILSDRNRLTEDELASYFIHSNIRHLKDVFLETLVYKNVIRSDHKHFVLIKPEDTIRVAEEKYNQMIRKLNSPRYHDYGYVYMTKERGKRFVSATKFQKYIENLHSTSDILAAEDKIYNLTLIAKLCEHFDENFISLFDKSEQECKRIILNSDISRWRDVLVSIQSDCLKLLKLQFEVEKVTEFSELQRLSHSIFEISQMGENQIEEYVSRNLSDKQSLESFDHNRNDKDANYFNPKLQWMTTQLALLHDVEERFQKKVEAIQNIIESIKNAEDTTRTSLNDLIVHSECRVSSQIKERLRGMCDNLLEGKQPINFDTIHIADIERELELVKQPTLQDYGKLSTAIRLLELLLKDEKSYLSLYSNACTLHEHLKNIVDREPLQHALTEYNQKLHRIHDQYVELRINIRLTDDILETVSQLQSRFNALIKEIETEQKVLDHMWQAYAINLRKSADQVDYILHLVSTKQSIDKTDIIQLLEPLKKYANQKSIGEVEEKLTKIEKLKIECIDRLFKLTKDILVQDEIKALVLVTKTKLNDDVEWIDQSKFYELALKEGLTRNSADSALNGLVAKGLLRRGVSLISS